MTRSHLISIRRARPDDLDFLFDLVNDEDVEPYLGGRASLDRESLLAEIDRSEAEVVLIPNTLELETLYITPPLLAAVEADPSLRLETDFTPIPFDADGTLRQDELFPESVRARRRGRGAG